MASVSAGTYPKVVDQNATVDPNEETEPEQHPFAKTSSKPSFLSSALLFLSVSFPECIKI